MSYAQGSAANDRRSHKLALQRRDAHVIRRYLQFYAALIVILSFISYLFDLLFYRIDYGSIARYQEGPISYILYYAIIGFAFLPLSIVYNALVNNVFSRSPLVRIVAGVLFFVLLGFCLNIRYQFGFYIGQFRTVKNLLSMGLAGGATEWLRLAIVAHRVRQAEARRNMHVA